MPYGMGTAQSRERALGSGKVSRKALHYCHEGKADYPAEQQPGNDADCHHTGGAQDLNDCHCDIFHIRPSLQ